MEYPKLDELNSNTCTEKSIKLKYNEFWEYIIKNYTIPQKWTEKLYWFYNNINTQPLCPTCGKPLKFLRLSVGYPQYCSTKCSNSSQDKKNKCIETCKNKYGGNAPASSRDILEKMNNTKIERYGDINYNNREKAHTTMNELYGGIGNASEEIKRKYILHYQLKNIEEKDFLMGYTDNGEWICKCPHPECNKCEAKQFITNYQIWRSRNIYKAEQCTNLLPIDNSRYKNTSLELFVQNILDEYNIEYITNDRNIIKPKELDIYIPSKHIAIECNGIYSHDSSHKTPNYHIDKSKICKEKGITLIHLWEDWIKIKPEIVKSIILNKLGLLDNAIYARKCIIKEVEPCECNTFLKNNHIQGESTSNLRYGLYYNDELVSLMTFSPPRMNMGAKQHKQQWELVRFCSKLNTRVIGGASKLFNHFIKIYNPDSIASFSMNDISNGNLYDKLGFINECENSSYWYIEPHTYKRYHRTSFSKQMIIKRGWKDNKEGWTEREVMEEQGYFRIYDAGQTKWVWNK